jgi:hypothetical protein
VPHAPGELPDVVTETPENTSGPSLRWVAAVLVVWLVIVVVYITWQLVRGSVA